MKTPKLHGWNDIVYIIAIVSIVAVITGFLLEHLHTRHELFVTARERSLTAYRVRQLKEEARHLELEEKIRASQIKKEDAGKNSHRAPAERTVGLSAEPHPADHDAHLPKEDEEHTP